jgi:hypothetical protein
MMPKDPNPGNGDRHGIRSDALLLPVSLRYDWQHSSSQLPITFSDARWTSSPSGRYYLRHTHGKPRLREQIPRKPADAPKSWAVGLCVALDTCALRIGAILNGRFRTRRRWPIGTSSVGRRSPPPKRPRQDWLLLPGCQSRSATPAGFPPRRALPFALHPNQGCMATLTLVAKTADSARISPIFLLDMRLSHRCRAVTALFFSAAQRIFQINRLGRRQGRAAAQ